MQSSFRFVVALSLTSALLGRALAAPSPADSGGAATAELPTVNFVQPPSWIERPTASQLLDVYPEQAQRMRISGAVLLTCVAEKDRSLSGCSIVAEEPPNQGFGPAAVRPGSVFKFAPHNVDGRSLESARVNIPLKFMMGGLHAHRLSSFKWEVVPETSGPPADANVGAAITRVCAPYVLDKADPASLATNHVEARDDGWRGLTFPQPDATVMRMGAAGFVHVAVYTAGDTRHCDVSVARSDPAGMRAVVLKALAERPEGFSPTRSRCSPGPFETEDLLCARPGGAHPGGFARLSVNAPTFARPGDPLHPDRFPEPPGGLRP